MPELTSQAGGDIGVEVTAMPTTDVQLVDEVGIPFGVKHIDNKIRTSSMPYYLDIAEGNVPDHAAFRRFGVNLVVPAAWETVTNQSAVQSYLTSAEQLKIVSTDATDDGDPVAAGARTLSIAGLDGDYNVVSETITLNGVGVVTTVNSYLRPLRAQVVTVGATGVNAGTITIKNNAATVTLLQIEPGEGQSNSAIWTVPADSVAYIVSWNASESSLKGAQVGLWYRPFGQSWRYVRSYVLLDNGFYHQFQLPLPMQARTDIEIRAKGLAAGAIVSAGFEGWYE